MPDFIAESANVKKLFSFYKKRNMYFFDNRCFDNQHSKLQFGSRIKIRKFTNRCTS